MRGRGDTLAATPRNPGYSGGVSEGSYLQTGLPQSRGAAWRSKRGSPCSANRRNLAGLPEKEVLQHLEHLERSFKADGKKLVSLPPRCLACGFAFRTRERLSTPSRCPECKSERIEAARFAVA